MSDYEPPFVHNDQGERSASIVQIDNGKTVAAVAICAAFAALGVGLSAFSVYTAQQSAMEARILSQQVIELRAELNNRKE
jgi:uncharacterized protein HemX